MRGVRLVFLHGPAASGKLTVARELAALTGLTWSMQLPLFLVIFGVATPVVLGVLGAVVGRLIGLSLGGTALLATLAASASYIAAPTAMRIAVPEANPAVSLAGSLGVTFPFNIIVGIPLYHWMATRLAGATP